MLDEAATERVNDFETPVWVNLLSNGMFFGRPVDAGGGGQRRWSGATRNWSPVGAVTLNPERDSIVTVHSEHIEKQPLAA